MFAYFMSLLLGLFAVLEVILLVNSSEWQIQGRTIALLAVLLAASAVFRVIAIWERELDDERAEG